VLLNVLLVEGDTPDEMPAMEQHLVSQGCAVKTVRDLSRVIALAEAEWPDLIVLNTCSRLPDMADMADVCAALEHSDLELPRLIVSDAEMDNSSPGCVYLSVPFTVRRLAYRIKRAIGPQTNRFLRAGDVCVDRLKRNVKCGGRVSHLTPKELSLLALLIERADQEVSRSTIMKEVWQTAYVGDTRTLEVHVRWLRQKLEDDPKHPKRIVTVRRRGYRFNVL
jgi:DNA-binding response OmpR family regulator